MIKNLSAFFIFTLLFSPNTFGQKNAYQLIEEYFKMHPRLMMLESSAANWEIERSTSVKNSAIQHHYLRQSIDGLPLLNGTAVFVEKDQTVFLSGNRLITSKNAPANKQSRKDPVTCLNLAWEELTGEKPSSSYTAQIHSDEKYVITNPDYSREEIPARLAYFFDGLDYRLIYEMSILLKDGEHHWNLYADAFTGQILYKNNWVVSCNFDNCTIENHAQKNNSSQNNARMMAPPPPPQNDSYRVFNVPIESPIHGPRTLVVGPFNSDASPFGWHDVNGLPGAEFTITRGNNVWASEDANDDDNPGYSPDGGANLIFDFPFSGGAPSSYQDAAITNLFYMNNIMHDVWYQYGFDEESGNFQQNNYGNPGLEDDAVFADAQDGSGTNNANFSTPPDGFNPRMQMFIWTDSPTSEFLVINSPSTLAGSYASSMASFAPQPPVVPITEDFVLVNSGGTEPLDACNSIINFSQVSGKIAIVKRGSCTFAQKAENCQNAGASALIVVNNVPTAPITMGGTAAVPINIPVIMVSQNDGNSIINTMNASITVNGSISDAAALLSTDSDLDNGVIAHEFGHGISNRLTGGPTNTDCLSNEDQMGEGWSDWFGLILTIEPGDLRTDVRGVGTYVSNQPTTGQGIRPAPYTTDFSINGYTYDATNNSSISRPHGIGFVWCTALWDLTWDFIEEYGYDSDIYGGSGGNNKIMKLVIEAMKLQPCSPGAVDGRDAILLADQLLNAGANECLIWKAFAKRGLGFNADQGDPDDRFDQVENFSIPQSCTAGLDENTLESAVAIYPNPTDDFITISSKNNRIEEITIQDIHGRIVEKRNNLSTHEVVMDASKFQTGVYFFVIDLNGETITRKIVRK